MILGEIEKTVSVFRDFAASADAIRAVDRIGNACGEALLKGGKILLAGNGGSAADAQHIAAEFVSRLVENRAPLPAIALTTDTSILTAVANDYGYEKVFQRQVDALGNPGDVLIAISTSGNSPSILEGLCAAKRKGIFTAGLTGQTGGKMAELCDAVVKVPSARTQNIQEVHIMVGHTICAMAERIYLNDAQSAQRVRPASVAG
ncbi:MAG TPA: D-sedoheptulose 7-phosphate isomerase [Terracidiphilus sp.]|nr:D-sedoheptulose 7-phosphate isomerase [Terracidiphilus sp.]